MASDRSISSRASRPWSRGAARTASYRLHVLVGLVLSLGVVTAAFRAPWGGVTRSAGWGAPSGEAFTVPLEENDPHPAEADAVLAGRYRIVPVAGEAPIRAKEDERAKPALVMQPDEAAPSPELKKLAPVLEFAEQAPELVGGLGNLYLHIRYPQAAIEQNIQGRLILKFVVEPDGQLSEIVVERSLHPLCDSAAVRALREVAFVPGRHGGEAARVRMRLPVRFQLVDPNGMPLADSSLAAAG